jgi:hypothetical protein
MDTPEPTTTVPEAASEKVVLEPEGLPLNSQAQPPFSAPEFGIVRGSLHPVPTAARSAAAVATRRAIIEDRAT